MKVAVHIPPPSPLPFHTDSSVLMLLMLLMLLILALLWLLYDFCYYYCLKMLSQPSACMSVLETAEVAAFESRVSR